MFLKPYMTFDFPFLLQPAWLAQLQGSSMLTPRVQSNPSLLSRPLFETPQLTGLVSCWWWSAHFQCSPWPPGLWPNPLQRHFESMHTALTVLRIFAYCLPLKRRPSQKTSPSMIFQDASNISKPHPPDNPQLELSARWTNLVWLFNTSVALN